MNYLANLLKQPIGTILSDSRSSNVEGTASSTILLENPTESNGEPEKTLIDTTDENVELATKLFESNSVATEAVQKLLFQFNSSDNGQTENDAASNNHKRDAKYIEIDVVTNKAVDAKLSSIEPTPPQLNMSISDSATPDCNEPIEHSRLTSIKMSVMDMASIGNPKRSSAQFDHLQEDFYIAPAQNLDGHPMVSNPEIDSANLSDNETFTDCQLLTSASHSLNSFSLNHINRSLGECYQSALQYTNPNNSISKLDNSMEISNENKMKPEINTSFECEPMDVDESFTNCVESNDNQYTEVLNSTQKILHPFGELRQSLVASPNQKALRSDEWEPETINKDEYLHDYTLKDSGMKLFHEIKRDVYSENTTCNIAGEFIGNETPTPINFSSQKEDADEVVNNESSSERAFEIDNKLLTLERTEIDSCKIANILNQVPDFEESKTSLNESKNETRDCETYDPIACRGSDVHNVVLEANFEMNAQSPGKVTSIKDEKSVENDASYKNDALDCFKCEINVEKPINPQECNEESVNYEIHSEKGSNEKGLEKQISSLENDLNETNANGLKDTYFGINSNEVKDVKKEASSISISVTNKGFDIVSAEENKEASPSTANTKDLEAYIGSPGPKTVVEITTQMDGVFNSNPSILSTCEELNLIEMRNETTTRIVSKDPVVIFNSPREKSPERSSPEETEENSFSSPTGLIQLKESENSENIDSLCNASNNSSEALHKTQPFIESTESVTPIPNEAVDKNLLRSTELNHLNELEISSRIDSIEVISSNSLRELHKNPFIENTTPTTQITNESDGENLSCQTESECSPTIDLYSGVDGYNEVTSSALVVLENGAKPNLTIDVSTASSQEPGALPLSSPTFPTKRYTMDKAQFPISPKMTRSRDMVFLDKSEYTEFLNSTPSEIEQIKSKSLVFQISPHATTMNLNSTVNVMNTVTPELDKVNGNLNGTFNMPESNINVSTPDFNIKRRNFEISEPMPTTNSLEQLHNFGTEQKLTFTVSPAGQQESQESINQTDAEKRLTYNIANGNGNVNVTEITPEERRRTFNISTIELSNLKGDDYAQCNRIDLDSNVESFRDEESGSTLLEAKRLSKSSILKTEDNVQSRANNDTFRTDVENALERETGAGYPLSPSMPELNKKDWKSIENAGSEFGLIPISILNRQQTPDLFKIPAPPKSPSIQGKCGNTIDEIVIKKRPSIHATMELQNAQTLSAKEQNQCHSRDEKDIIIESNSFPSVNNYAGSLADMFSGLENSSTEDFSDRDFQAGNNLILQQSDFDYLLTKGSNNVQVDRSSLLLKFDPLVGLPVVVANLPYKQQQIQQTLNTNNLNLSPTPEEDEQEPKDDNNLRLPLQSSLIQGLFGPTGPYCDKLKDALNQDDQGLNATKTKKYANMSADVIKDITLENDCNKTFENLNTQLDDKQCGYKMDDLEKKIKNEVLKTEDIEKKLKEAEQREEALIKRITEKDKTIVKMNGVIEEYEKAIAELIAGKEELIQNHDKQLMEIKADRDSNYHHLTSLEMTFSDLHVKYEKSKEMTLQLKANEDALLTEKRQNLENLRQQEQRYDKMKNYAMQQLEIANNKLETLTKDHAVEMTKLKALLKKEEISRASINEQLQQKSRENAELVKICDELINGQGS